MTAADHILSVTEVNRRARQLLEIHLSTVWVRGEISNLSTPSSGHWYFTLKDDKAQLKCAMFRGQNALLRFRPEHGMQVIVRGRVSIYEGRGDYQLIVENLTPDGAGNLQIAFEQLKSKLTEEGLFDEEHKQALPELPQHIGVITSASGAAVRDILTVFQRRCPGIVISILPVPVQGAEAAPAIVRALALANNHTDIDAIILARGGGSLEDLWAFNEESVVRAVFASRLPVVSAIGHETDFTICDFVADLRAPTPSAAAELLSPDQDALRTFVVQLRNQLDKSIQRSLSHPQRQLLHLLKRLKHPVHILREQQQRLDHLEWRLRNTFQQQQQRRQQLLAHAQHRLQRCHPQQQLEQARQRQHFAGRQLALLILKRIHDTQTRLTHQTALLDTVSPLSTLKRGYAIASDIRQQVITRSTQAKPGMALSVRLADGALDCTVQSIHPATEN